MSWKCTLYISKCHPCDGHHRRTCKHLIVSSRLATLLRFVWRYMRWYAMVCDASRSSKSQENDSFHRIVWQGL